MAFNIETWFKVYAHHLPTIFMLSLHTFQAKKNIVYRYFLKRFAMTLTFDLETYIQVFQKYQHQYPFAKNNYFCEYL